MEIVWDDHKRLQNFAKHGFDFVDIVPEFFEEAVVVPAKSGRLMAIGILADGTIAVVFVSLSREAVSVISMSRASRKERNIYEQKAS